MLVNTQEATDVANEDPEIPQGNHQEPQEVLEPQEVQGPQEVQEPQENQEPQEQQDPQVPQDLMNEEEVGILEQVRNH